MDSSSLVLFLFAIGIVQVDCQEGPKVAPFSSLVKPAIGGRISFLCHSLTGSPPFQIFWFKDGKDLQDTPEIRIGAVQDSSVLLVDSLKSSHSGNYTCKISNRYGSDSYTTELLVEGPPNWIKKPNNVKLKMHQMINIQCLVSGYPKPMITWKKLQGSSWARIDVQHNGDLRIMNATKNYGGRYGCSASNGNEPDLWSEFDISIDGSVYNFDKCSATWKWRFFS